MASIKILLDAGHYSKYNRSPVVPTYYEGDRVWKLSQYLAEALKSYGFTVGSTKGNIDNYPKTSSGGDDVYKRGQMARGYDLMLSLHSNACDTESVDRAVVIHPVSDTGKPIASKLGRVVQTAMGLSSYQVYERANSAGKDYYGVIRGAASVGVPCIIIEHGFHTNKKCATWLMSDTNLKALAETEAATIAEHYGMGKSLYRVQVGAFGKKENADNMLKRLKAAGFDGFIVKV